MQIHKFGGASISTAARIEKLPAIIQSLQPSKNLIVISALGKTTNALENVVDLFLKGSPGDAAKALSDIRALHLQLMRQLLGRDDGGCENELNALFEDAHRAMTETPTAQYNRYYDRVVSFGEMFSTTLVSCFLNHAGIKNTLIDARQVISTNSNFGEAGVLWDQTAENINRLIVPAFGETDIIITQGFIGSTEDKQPTTLGREGSDFSAAIFANLLKAEKLSIWKDVEGLMNADPRIFSDACVIRHLPYKEVIEMAYYGAQVIHPKTIKPLQNKEIPLYVRCFLKPEADGTLIDNSTSSHPLPPIYVLKQNQTLISFQTRDFSFIEGKPTHHLNSIIANALMKANLSQNTAISLLVCLDNQPEKINEILQLATDFDVRQTAGLTLLTIRHYTPACERRILSSKEIILQQRTAETLQVLYRESA